MSGRKPWRWPRSVQFITVLWYHNSVPPSTLALLTGTDRASSTSPSSSSSSSSSPTQVINPLVRIRLVTDPSHPAYGQCGLFAYKKIPPRSHIIDYIGEVHCEERDSDYDLSLYRSQDGINVGVDARDMGNEARFINDYRGVQGKPNAEFVEHRTSAGELRMGIWTTGEAINKGDEILVSYGKSWWRNRHCFT